MRSRNRNRCGPGAAIIAAAIVFAAGAPAAAKIVYVDGVNGNDNWNGLSQEWDGGTWGPKKTIQAGINATVDGDEVIVADAVYGGDGNLNLVLNGRAILLRSANGPENCIIDGANAPIRAFSFYVEELDTVIDGFMVTKFSSC